MTRPLAILALALTALACNPTKLLPGRCNTTGDCKANELCDTQARKCVEKGDGSVDGDAKDASDASDVSDAFNCDLCTDGGVCDFDASRCVECFATTHCANGTTNVCDIDASRCVECLADSDCTTATKPICNKTTLTCDPCTTDAQCAAKVPTPGICMFHQDGRCATDDETIYVESKTGCLSSTNATGGTADMPFCKLQDALSAIGIRRLLLVRGSGDVGNASIQNLSVGQISIIGPGSRITAAAGSPGLKVTGSDVFVRGVKILGDSGTDVGIVAESGATIRLDSVTVENMSKGGLRVVGAGYDITNSLFAGNGGTIDDGGRFIGGAFLSPPPNGQVARFAFNTVVANNRDGVICGSASQSLEGSLLVNNLGGGSTPDASNCTLSLSKTTMDGAPNLTTTDPKYRLTANSPCRNAIAVPPSNAPDHDIDGNKRPQEGMFDCGADEF